MFGVIVIDSDALRFFDESDFAFAEMLKPKVKLRVDFEMKRLELQRKIKKDSQE